MKLLKLFLLGCGFLSFGWINSAAASNENNTVEPQIQDKTKMYQTLTTGRYGNWCGVNHPKIISSAADPIDTLDAACKRHDICYEKKGYFHCSCDKALVHEIDDELKQRKYAGKTFLMARSIKAHFFTFPCDGNTEDKVFPTRVLSNVYQNAKHIVTDIFNRIVNRNGKNSNSAAAESDSEANSLNLDDLQKNLAAQ